MMGEPVLHTEVSHHVATVTFSRPPVNAVDRAAYLAIRDEFRTFGERTDVRAVIFTASGERAFMAGADIKEQRQLAQAGVGALPIADRLDRGRLIRESLWSLRECPVPVIVALNGPAIGAGLAFAAMADIVVACTGTTLAATEIDVGLLGAGAHLIRLVGHYRARELFYTAQPVTVEELAQRGTVARVVSRAELLAAANDIAAVIADKSPIAVRLAKEAFNRTEALPLSDAYRIEQDYTTRLRQFDDSAEAQRAFVEKDEPQWRWQ